MMLLTWGSGMFSTGLLDTFTMKDANGVEYTVPSRFQASDGTEYKVDHTMLDADGNTVVVD